jgi:thioredoxin reductase (NADPH)
MRYDLAIIGTGPAGLEAAITASIRKLHFVLLGSPSSSNKVAKAHAIQNYLGLPDLAGEDMQKRFLDHARKMGVTITPEQITAVYSMGDYFILQGAKDNYEASSVILATGVVNGKPYPGEEKYLGRGVSYCATCDAAFYKGKKVAVIGGSPKEESEAEFLMQYAAEVLYFPLYKEPVSSTKLQVVNETPREILGGDKVTALAAGDEKYEVDGVFILREAVAPGQLVPGLETDGPHVKVNLDMSTSLPGMFAAGDLAGLPYQYIKAAGQGNVAALSAAAYVTSLKQKAKA